MKTKCIYIIALLFLSSNFALSQVNYIARDTTLVNNLKLLPSTRKNNAHFIAVMEGGNIVKYYPPDLQEYGLKDGRIFRSISINQNKQTSYFFERIYNKEFQIFYLPEKIEKSSFYFAMSDTSSIVPIPSNKKELGIFFKDHLKNCPLTLRDIKYLKSSRESVIRLLNNYQHCDKSSYFPRIRFGLSLGFSLINFSELEIKGIQSININNASGFAFSGYVDLPIKSSNFSLQTGLTFYEYKSSTLSEASPDTYDLVINQRRISTPLCIRYAFHMNKLIPFVEGGLIYSKELSGKSELYKYQTSGSDIYIDIITSNYIPTDQIGFSSGFGFFTNNNSKFSFVMQIKFNRLLALKDQNDLMVNEAFLMGGLIF